MLIRDQILRCKALTKSFDGVQALANLTLEFPSSGSVAIIGPNGAGKTTLLNVLTGILRPDGGSARLGEHELTILAPYKIAKLGLARTFQDLRLISQVTVLENVMLASPDQTGERILPALFRFRVAAEEARNRTKAMEHLRFVGLSDVATKFAGELSYGQQKLLTLACCLATNAHILLLDEPIAGVHPETAESILGLLRHLGNTGRQVVFIEHDISSVRKLADLVVVMDQGRVIAQGHPKEVLVKREIIEAYVG